MGEMHIIVSNYVNVENAHGGLEDENPNANVPFPINGGSI
jgi:hypothetical protein